MAELETLRPGKEKGLWPQVGYQNTNLLQTMVKSAVSVWQMRGLKPSQYHEYHYFYQIGNIFQRVMTTVNRFEGDGGLILWEFSKSSHQDLVMDFHGRNLTSCNGKKRSLHHLIWVVSLYIELELQSWSLIVRLKVFWIQTFRISDSMHVIFFFRGSN